MLVFAWSALMIGDRVPVDVRADGVVGLVDLLVRDVLVGDRRAVGVLDWCGGYEGARAEAALPRPAGRGSRAEAAAAAAGRRGGTCLNNMCAVARLKLAGA